MYLLIHSEGEFLATFPGHLGAGMNRLRNALGRLEKPDCPDCRDPMAVLLGCLDGCGFAAALLGPLPDDIVIGGLLRFAVLRPRRHLEPRLLRIGR